METINKGGRPTTADRTNKLRAFYLYRSQGKNQKETAQLVGITEKTAGKYERMRLKQLPPTTADLIAILEAKAKDKTTTAKDLVQLTKEIDRLTEKQKTEILFIS